ncbi:MAG: HEAT repeat domain-containing protein [Bradymonadales bacterium]|nr:HEAT repeat domain-containing protein [Bradymonadales bacterium]
MNLFRLRYPSIGSRGLLCALLVTVWQLASCDARRSEETVPVVPAGEREGQADPYATLPPSVRQPLEQTWDPIATRRLEALRALEQQADPRVLDRLVELLLDGDEHVRCVAARVLGSFGSEADPASEFLVELLADRSPLVRQCALWALAQVGGDLPLQALLEFLQQADGDELEPTIDALGRLGRIEAVPVLLGYLESDQAALVYTAQRALVRIGPGAIESVRPLLRSAQPWTRCAVATTLAQWESVQDQQELHRLAHEDGDPMVRVCASGALGRLGDEAAVEELVEILSDPTSPSRARAAQSLGLAATGPAMRALIRALTTFDQPEGGNPAQEALISMGRPVIPTLEEAIFSGPPLRRALVAQTLGLLGDPSAIPTLRTALMDTDPRVRQAAEEALQRLTR